MRCDLCDREAVTFVRYNGSHLCDRHFMRYVDRRVKREIRKQIDVKHGDRIAVAVSGGKDSMVALKMISSVLGTLINVGAIALIIIFQPEIRRFLNSLGRRAGDTLERRSFLGKIFPKQIIQSVNAKSVTEIAEACREMSDQRTGALIIIRKKDTLQEIIDTGDVIDARISRRLIMNIFYKNSPLHDGAMIIGDDRIIAARCTLPITDRSDLPARFGMRHKAAVGISEQSDADVVVVSEQTGGISFVRSGKVRPIDSISNLKLLLAGELDNERPDA